jgi:hypothetical protein
MSLIPRTPEILEPVVLLAHVQSLLPQIEMPEELKHLGFCPRNGARMDGKYDEVPKSNYRKYPDPGRVCRVVTQAEPFEPLKPRCS